MIRSTRPTAFRVVLHLLFENGQMTKAQLCSASGLCIGSVEKSLASRPELFTKTKTPPKTKKELRGIVLYGLSKTGTALAMSLEGVEVA